MSNSYVLIRCLIAFPLEQSQSFQAQRSDRLWSTEKLPQNLKPLEVHINLTPAVINGREEETSWPPCDACGASFPLVVRKSCTLLFCKLSIKSSSLEKQNLLTSRPATERPWHRDRKPTLTSTRTQTLISGWLWSACWGWGWITVMSGAADDAGALLLLLAVCGDQDDIKQQRLSRICLQQTSIHFLECLKIKTRTWIQIIWHFLSKLQSVALSSWSTGSYWQPKSLTNGSNT